jgi:uncharacterized protein YciI
MPYTISADEVRQKTKGMLQRELYVVVTSPVPGREDLLNEVTPAHLAHQVRMEQEGHMVAAGPLLSEDSQSFDGTGMFILRAPSISEARKLCEIDPMHVSGARTYTIRPWMVNEGGVTVRVSFSDQRGEFL